MKCRECDREMRGYRDSAKEFPGTVRRATKDLCSACYERDKYVVKSDRQERPTHCKDCGAEVRKRGTRAAEHPGSREYYGKGLCFSCHNRRKKGLPPKPYVPQYAKVEPEPLALAEGSALTSFLASRRKRGVPTRGRKM